jgi:hypothetical protein
MSTSRHHGVEPGTLIPLAPDMPASSNAPALVDVVTSQSAISSDARKGLGFHCRSRRRDAFDVSRHSC